MTTLTRTKTDGAWSTTEDVGGGGGGELPAWWTVESTPGSERVIFGGAVDVSPGSDSYDPLIVRDANDDTIFSTLLTGSGQTVAIIARDNADVALTISGAGAPTAALIDVEGGTVVVGPSGALTLYNSTDPDVTTFLVSVDDLKNGSYQYAEFASDGEWTARLFLNEWSLKGLTGEGRTGIGMSSRDGGGILNISSGDGSDYVYAADGATVLFRVLGQGAVTISPDAVDGYTSALNVQGPDGLLAMLGLFATYDGESVSIDNEGRFRVQSALGVSLIDARPIDNKLAFFNATPVVKPTGVAVTAGGIHAALVTLGLIAA